ncbi:MAG: serine/threonine protein kinase [Myxococcales bacterium]|nr:MAG: serine/threonine protein kinase [Myxococcales bacterium]
MQDSLIGKVLAGSYRVDAHVADGGIGRVYRGTHLRLGHTVAIKVLNAEYRDTEDAQKRFEREARLAAELNHPHIIKVFDFDRLDDGRYFIALEWLEGHCLRELIEETLLPEQRTLELLEQIASAVDYAHERGVIHRDLKPDNVFVIQGAAGRDFVKVLDFGLAKNTESKHSLATQTGSVLGTPAYMAPEQAEGSKHIGPEADRYAFAAIALELFTGELPYEVDSPSRMLVAILTKEPRLPSELGYENRSLDHAFERALSRSVHRRFSSCIAFVAALREILSAASKYPSSTDPKSVFGTAPTVSLHTPRLKSYRLGILLIVIAVSLLGVGIYAATRSQVPKAAKRIQVSSQEIEDTKSLDSGIELLPPPNTGASKVPKQRANVSSTKQQKLNTSKKTPKKNKTNILPKVDEVFGD